MSRRNLYLTALVGLGLLLAGCGSGGAATPGPSSVPTVAARAKVPPTGEGAAVIQAPAPHPGTTTTTSRSIPRSARAKHGGASAARTAGARAKRSNLGLRPSPRSTTGGSPTRSTRHTPRVSGLSARQLCTQVVNRALSISPARSVELEELCKTLRTTRAKPHS